MVVIHMKRTESDQFLYECSTADSNDKVVRELCAIHNLRDKIARLASACEELATHGPSKPEAEKGIDEIQERDGKRIEKGPYYNADPLGNRTGNAPAPGLQETLKRTAQESLAAISRSLATSGVALTVAGLQERVDLMRGAVTMAYPMGLPDYDPVRLLIEDDGTAAGFLASVMGAEFMDPETASLWWAGKEFFRDQTVGDRVGRNEKTKVVAKLQRKGGGAPAREPAVSEEERKAMMAWYFKKQEEEKALAEDRDDSYMAGSWADPRALKSDLLGTRGINWRPGAAGGGGGRR